MLPALRLGALALAALLVPATAAQAAPKLSVPAEAQVAVVVGSGLKSVKVKSAPSGVTVAGGATRGRFAVAVVRPRGAAGSGKVVLTVKGKPKGVKTFKAALRGGKAGAACPTLSGLLSKRLKGAVDMKALAPIVAAKLCGRSAPAGAETTLSRLGLGPVAGAPSAPGGPSGGSLSRPGSGPVKPPGPTPTPAPNGKRACENGIDDDRDGQTDWQDPGCEHAGDNSEDSEVPVPAECAASSGISMGDETTGLYVGINSGCGMFRAIEIDVAPGVESCKVFTADDNFGCQVFAPTAHAWTKNDRPTDMADVLLTLTAPADCSRVTTIALHRPSGEVAELQEPIQSCKTGPAPKPACSNGKDDDGDGMKDALGGTDPDPGCSGPNDRTEDSEVPTPASCEIQIGVFDSNPRLPGLIADGCGVLKGVWFKPPGTPVGCAFAFTGEEDARECTVRGGIAEAAFALTNQSVLLAAPIAANAACGPVTVALIREDDSVMADRVQWC